MQNTRGAIKALLPEARTIETYFDKLWPICRSITGNGLRESFRILQEIIPLELTEVPTGTRVLDWTVPNEWNISEAFIEDESGQHVVDFAENNLHVVGYSVPIDQRLSLDELQKHLHSLPAQPNAIPYRTNYYTERWGFCLEDRKRQQLRPGQYRVVIKSKLQPGALTYGQCLLPATTGDGKDEVLISSYLCHPSLANNELSGPLVTSFLYHALSRLPTRRYSYRFAIVPETIGAIAFLASYGKQLKSNCRAGLVVTCVGDDHHIHYKKTRDGNATIDRCVIDALEAYKRETGKDFRVLDFFPTGSDERQYCSPGFNLPVGSLIRSLYNKFPEYHTSLDNKSFVSFDAHVESIELYMRALLSFEHNQILINTKPYGEPMLGPRGLYPSLGADHGTEAIVNKMMYLLNFSDGRHELYDIALKAKCSILDLVEVAGPLLKQGLLRPAAKEEVIL